MKTCCVAGCNAPRAKSQSRCRAHYRAQNKAYKREYLQRPGKQQEHAESKKRHRAAPAIKAKIAAQDRDRRSDPAYREAEADRQRQRLYGLSPEEHLILLEQQDDQCATCGADGPLHVDHCHTEGHVRGLLCPNCNRALGLLAENAETLETMIAYVS